MSKLRVMFLTGKYPPQHCGIGDYTYRLAEQLSQKEVESYVCTSRLDDHLDVQGARIARVMDKWDFKSYPIIVRLLRENNIDILHIQFHAYAFNAHPAVVFLPLWLRFKRDMQDLKTIVTMHELAGPKVAFFPGSLRRLWLLPLLLGAQGIVVTNEYYARLLSVFSFLKKKLYRVPIGPNINLSGMAGRPSARIRTGIQENEIVIVRFGFVHNLRVSYLPQILEAIKLLKDRGYPARLFLVGGLEEADRREVASILEGLQISSSVTLTGYSSHEEVLNYLGSADIAIQMYPEGASEKRTGLITVMAAGLATVCLKKGRLPSLFASEENVFFVSDANAKSIAAGLERLIVDKGFRENIARKAKASVARLTWDAAAQLTKEAYENLASCKGRGFLQ